MTRSKVAMHTLVPDRVSMYVCGPTVYDLPHLGHGRTALTYDVLRRYLRWTGYRVTMVANVTDIDDNIIGRANREGRTEPEVAAEYLGHYVDQLDRLGIEHPDRRPKATEFIEGMIETIRELIEVGAAYVAEGRGVYFDVTSAPDYGRLAGRDLQQLLEDAGQRVEVDQAKRSPLDFALWKAAKPGEPAWDTPWGPGRPGWHTECVSMSMSILGETFDIHGGGDDLTFPHHQNEQAQAAAAGHGFARLWMHSAMLNVSGEKMSKSLGNFTTLAEALDAYDPRAVRLSVLQTHYRSTMEMGPESLAQTAEAVKRLDAMVRRATAAGVELGPTTPTTGDTDIDHLDADTVARFREAMDDDMSTPGAIDAVFGAVRNANSALDDGRLEDAARLATTVVLLCSVVGLEIGEPEAGGSAGDGAQIEGLVASRQQARSDRDFAAADAIRDELAALGVVVEDTGSGPVWHRV
ncbi:MAG: cysteine--tRNA ligase [Actinomycetia bacterium]|nr:cysteine--tRNA ligase [Actinomycetes bacterium]